MFALAGIIGPLLGTQVFQYGGVPGLALVCGLTFFGVLALWLSVSKPQVRSSDAKKAQ